MEFSNTLGEPIQKQSQESIEQLKESQVHLDKLTTPVKYKKEIIDLLSKPYVKKETAAIINDEIYEEILRPFQNWIYKMKILRQEFDNYKFTIANYNDTTVKIRLTKIEPELIIPRYLKNICVSTLLTEKKGYKISIQSAKSIMFDDTTTRFLISNIIDEHSEIICGNDLYVAIEEKVLSLLNKCILTANEMITAQNIGIVGDEKRITEAHDASVELQTEWSNAMYTYITYVMSIHCIKLGIINESKRTLKRINNLTNVLDDRTLILTRYSTQSELEEFIDKCQNIAKIIEFILEQEKQHKLTEESQTE